MRKVVYVAVLFVVTGFLGACGDRCPVGVNYTDPSCPGYVYNQGGQVNPYQNPYQNQYQQPYQNQYQQPYQNQQPSPYQNPQYWQNYYYPNGGQNPFNNPNYQNPQGQWSQWGTQCPFGPGSINCYGYGYQYPPFYYAQ